MTSKLSPAQIREVRDAVAKAMSARLGSYATKTELNAAVIGAGAVSSVNGQAGSVTLTTANVSDSGQSNRYVTEAQLAIIDAAAPVIVYDTVGNAWPECSAPSDVVQVWVQPEVNGDPPTLAGRPGAVDSDIVIIRQAS